jgi:BMFP domain-containing protein YqiC
MSEKITENLDRDRSFQDRVFARFDALEVYLKKLDSRVENIDSRVQVLESRAYDTKPIWENALKEIVDTRRELTRRLDRIEGMVLETRAGLGEAEDRLNKLESRPT